MRAVWGVFVLAFWYAGEPGRSMYGIRHHDVSREFAHFAPISRVPIGTT